MNKRYSANIYIIISIAVGYIFSAVVPEKITSALMLNIVNILNNILTAFVPIVIFAFADKISFKGFFNKVPLKTFGKCILITPLVWCAATYFNVQLNEAFKNFGIEVIQQLPEEKSAGTLISGFVLACIVAPIFEETLYRGVVLSLLRKYSNGLAVLVSALLFAVGHGSITIFGMPFVMGIAMAVITIKTGSIYPAMFMHFITNFLSWIMMAVDFGVAVSAAISIVMITVGAACLIWALIKIIRNINRIISSLDGIWAYIKNPTWIVILANYIYTNFILHG